MKGTQLRASCFPRRQHVYLKNARSSPKSLGEVLQSYKTRKTPLLPLGTGKLGEDHGTSISDGTRTRRSRMPCERRCLEALMWSSYFVPVICCRIDPVPTGRQKQTHVMASTGGVPRISTTEVRSPARGGIAHAGRRSVTGRDDSVFDAPCKSYSTRNRT